MAKTKIITREDAINNGLANYYTGIPCHKGHLSKRRTLNGVCLKCDYDRAKAKRIEIKAKRIEAQI